MIKDIRRGIARWQIYHTPTQTENWEEKETNGNKEEIKKENKEHKSRFSTWPLQKVGLYVQLDIQAYIGTDIGSDK